MNSQKKFYIVSGSITYFILFILISTGSANAQSLDNYPSKNITAESLQVRDNPLFDHVINRRGGSRLTLATGIPFVGLAEYAYGVTNWLARPNINFEWVTKSNVRYKVGGSAILAASNNSLFGDADEATLNPGLWSSVHGGVSMPLGGNMSFQTEISYVSKGVQPIKDFVGAPPVILVLGISYTL